MTTKRTKKSESRRVEGSAAASSRPAKRANVVWKFKDGTEERMPLTDHERVLMKQYHQMIASDSFELQEAGARKIEELSERLAAEELRRVGSVKGGQNKEEPEWHAECEKRARSMLATGTKPHELVGKLSGSFPYNKSSIRAALVKKGVLKKKKRQVS